MNIIPGERQTTHQPIANIDFGPIPPEIAHDRRAVAEEEARRDLMKSYEQLLADSHHEITDPSPNRNPAINLGFSNRRLGGIWARSAMAMEKAARSSDKAAQENIKLQEKVVSLTEKLKKLTTWLFWLTIAMALFAFVGLYPTGKAILQDIHGQPNSANGTQAANSANNQSNPQNGIVGKKQAQQAAP